MGKVLGTAVRHDVLSQCLPLLWKPRDKMDIIDLGRHILLFKFDLQTNYDCIMRGGPWFFSGHYLM